MKENIQRYLQQLVGLTLTDTARSSDMECFKFNNVLKINEEMDKYKKGMFALHLQCPWRFTSDTQILVGSLDLFEPIEPATEYYESFVWDQPNGNLRDFKLLDLLKQNLKVISVVADNFGGFGLNFLDNIALTVFPSLSKVDDYSEYWRLIDNRIASSNHVVVSASGLRQD